MDTRIDFLCQLHSNCFLLTMLPPPTGNDLAIFNLVNISQRSSLWRSLVRLRWEMCAACEFGRVGTSSNHALHAACANTSFQVVNSRRPRTLVRVTYTSLQLQRGVGSPHKTTEWFQDTHFLPRGGEM
jgi:hypothetical protein